MLSDPSKFVFIELPLSCMVSQDGSTVTWVLRNWRQMEKGHNDLHELPLCKMLSICKVRTKYKQQLGVIKIIYYTCNGLVPAKIEKWGPDLLFLF